MISIAMTQSALVVAAASLWLGVGLAAQQSGLSPLRASIERASMRLALTRAVDDLSSKDSTGVETASASTQRSGDWSAVQRLRPGTQGSVLREDVSTVRLPHKRILEYTSVLDCCSAVQADSLSGRRATAITASSGDWQRWSAPCTEPREAPLED